MSSRYWDSAAGIGMPGRAIERRVLEIVASSTRPAYAYGVVQAALLAGALRIRRVACFELGVGGGEGLLELERLGDLLGDEYHVEFQTFGIDGGKGLPQPVDYRDLPYVWRQGFYKLDESALKPQLKRGELWIGDVGEVLERLFAANIPPVGFVAFDLDLYSSTASALAAMSHAAIHQFLPRTICYFDDTVGSHEELHSEWTGELLAISEFNASSSRRKMAKINGLRYKLMSLDAPWVDGMYALHLFDHAEYATYVFPEANRQ